MSNAKMSAMKAIMDYADDAEGSDMQGRATARRESAGGLSDPNFMKNSSKGAEHEPAADPTNGEPDHDDGDVDMGKERAGGMADEEESDNPIKKLLGMFGGSSGKGGGGLF